MLCCINGGLRYFKSRTVDEGLTSVFNHGILFLFIMSAMADKMVLALYIVAAGLIFALTTPPCVAWQGQQKDGEAIPELTPLMFRDTVLNATSGAAAETTFVVVFYASWSPHCRALAPMFLDLASRYSLPGRIQFYKLDVGQYYTFAKQLGIEVSPSSKQLPTTAMYEKGEEQKRVPKRIQGTVVGAGLGMHEIAKALELDIRKARHGGAAESKKDK